MGILRYKTTACAIIIVCIVGGWGACSRLPYARDENKTPPEESKDSGEKSLINVFSVRSSPGVENLAVWVDDGKDTAFTAQNGGSVILLCNPSPEAKVMAAANLAAGIEGYAGTNALSDTVTADISRMTASRITAFASASRIILPGSNSFSVTAERAVAKIRLEQISNNISEGAYSGKAITIERVFIINGIGRYRLFPGAGTENYRPQYGRWWFSPSGIVRTEGLSNVSLPQGEGLMEAPSLSYSVIDTTAAYGETLQLNVELLTGPNDVSRDYFSNGESSPSQSIWQPRKTRLVVQCTIDGVRCYYPVTISDIDPNKIYLVKKLSLVNFGTTAPDQPYLFQEGCGSITVEEWTEQNLTERI